MRYFNQTVNWAKFFETANADHQVYFWQNNQLKLQNQKLQNQKLEIENVNGNLPKLETENLEKNLIKSENLKLENSENEFQKIEENSNRKSDLKAAENSEKENLIIIYEYPWQFGLKMWYIPRLWLSKNSLKNENWQNYLAQNLVEIAKIAKTKNITFIKFELDFGLENSGNCEQITDEKLEMENLEKLEKMTKIESETKSETEQIEKEILQRLAQNLDKTIQKKIQKSSKKLQYLQTLILDLNQLKLPVLAKISKNVEIEKFKIRENEKNEKSQWEIDEGENLELEVEKRESQIATFWHQNDKIWLKIMDKRTRYGTRKAVEFGWQFSVEKSPENFEIFYNLAEETSLRQGFAIHSKNYLQKLFKQEFARIIVLFDKNVAQAAWLGIWQLENKNSVLTNLYGGNSLISRDNYGQYFLHLAAIFLAKLESEKLNLVEDTDEKKYQESSQKETEKISQTENKIPKEILKSSQNQCFYDLGGLESGKGFDLFKKGYIGEIRNFVGPFDIILQPKKYQLVNQIIKFGKFWQNLKNQIKKKIRGK